MLSLIVDEVDETIIHSGRTECDENSSVTKPTQQWSRVMQPELTVVGADAGKQTNSSDDCQRKQSELKARRTIRNMFHAVIKSTSTLIFSYGAY